MKPFALVVFLTASVCADPPSGNDNSSLPDDRIVGGKPVLYGNKIPYQVGLYYYGSFICGGSIINANFVITAAHCTDHDKKRVNYYIRSGSLYHVTGGVLTDVASINQHPYYNRYTIENDICILKLAITLTFGPTTSSIPLPSSKTSWSRGQLVLVTGWGRTNEGGSIPAVLQEVTVPVVDKTVCEDSYGRYYLYIAKNTFCAGSDHGKDGCQGDSGGPAVIDGVLAGIVSFGIGCARPGYPGVYTNVAAYLDFINNVITK